MRGGLETVSQVIPIRPQCEANLTRELFMGDVDGAVEGGEEEEEEVEEARPLVSRRDLGCPTVVEREAHEHNHLLLDHGVRNVSEGDLTILGTTKCQKRREECQR